MELHDLHPAKGSTRNRKRLGRGTGSGSGKTSGRGHKGAGQRSGFSRHPHHEGGQMPLARRLPKRGFTNIFKKTFQVVNIGDLSRCQGGDITGEVLKNSGLVRKADDRIKVLGNGEIDRAVNVRAHAFSISAVAKIEAAGGKAELI